MPRSREPNDPSDRVRLVHMRDAAREAMSFVSGRDRRDLDTDRKTTKKAAKASASTGATPKRNRPTASTEPPMPVLLLSGGNPQIAKGDGDAPVQAYIAAMPGWKRDVGRLLDAIITRTIPGVHKAVKWNSPFYGVENDGWFLSYHCFANYVKVGFFRGTSLRPLPPGESKQKEVRYLDIHRSDIDGFDEIQFAKWVKQASRLPGEKL